MSWPDPYGPAADLVPFDAWVVTPTAAEARVWREALYAFYEVTTWLSQSLRVIWFDGGDPTLLGRMYDTSPPVVLLRSGRRLEDLRGTAFHELAHVNQTSFEAAWTRDEGEADAEAFARRMTRPR